LTLSAGWSRWWFVLNAKNGKLGYTKKPKENMVDKIEWVGKISNII